MDERRIDRFATSRLSRRDALRVAGGAGAAALLGARSARRAAAQEPPPTFAIPDPAAPLPSESVTLRWVDSGDVKALFWESFFAAYQEKHPNVTVQYDALPWNEIAQVVPLGVQGGNAHDVFQLPLNVPGGQAVREGWVAPLDDIIPNFAAWKAAFPPGTFVPGITDFNGKSYMVPLTTTKRHDTLLLYNSAYLAEAGYDPAARPLTWDEFRDAARKVTERGGGDYFGVIVGGNQTNQWSLWVANMGRIAGAASSSPGGGVGSADIDWRTGEYVYASDGYLAAIDLLLAMKEDGTIHPGSGSYNAPQARAQMPQGAAGMILQGPWNIPLWQRDNPDFEFGVGGQPVPAEGAMPLSYGPGSSNPIWIYADSPNTAIAGDIFSYVMSLEGQRLWGQIVDVADPPMFPEAQRAEGGNPLSAKAYALFDEQLRLGPNPRVRNPDVSLVDLEYRPLTPDFGQVVQGLFSGQLRDPRAAMQDLADRSEAELERAIEAARAKGAQVTRDDWVFANWDPMRDYTEADYAASRG